MNPISKVRKTVTSWRCEICGKEWESRKLAESRCGVFELEEAKFKVGDQVNAFFHVPCEGCGKVFQLRGEIVSVRGPKIGHHVAWTEEKWAKDKSIPMFAHVYEYSIKCSCPHCEREYSPYNNKLLEAKRLSPIQ